MSSSGEQPQSTLAGVPVPPSETQIQDFVSGKFVRRTPEEVEAVQVFSRRLVEDYGYPKENIQTRPQFRVKQSPSGREKWPVDIAVFNDPSHRYDDAYIIVECKRKNRKDGRKQLEIYMNLCPAHVGIWFNGSEHLYIKKVVKRDGTLEFPEIPVIPRFGQPLTAIGKIKRNELRKPSNLKATFKDIRNHLAGMTTGITRDEALARELINILFCKIYDEINTAKDDYLSFVADDEDTPRVVQLRIQRMFNDKVKTEYADVFDATDAITLDPESLVYVVGELQNYALTEATREAIGEAFEVFIGPALRGSEGQFFTPRNVVKMMVDALDPKPTEAILDPACGSGGFLIVALENVWRRIDQEGRRMGWDAEQTVNKKRDVANRFFRGIDKDSFLAKVTKAYMAIVGDGRGGVFCENSLAPPETWNSRTTDKIELGAFRVLITNPPFGVKIPIKGDETLQQYELARRWKEQEDGSWARGQSWVDSRPPQVLFIERCLQFLEEGGRMGIVLPEGIFGNHRDAYILEYLFENTKILAVVSLAQETFLPWAHAKTSILLLEKRRPERDYEFFMAIASKVGHDKNGKDLFKTDKVGKLVLDESGAPILDDDLPAITQNYKLYREGRLEKQSEYGFVFRLSQLKNRILIPHYYDPVTEEMLAKARQSRKFIFVSFGDLKDGGHVSIKRGDEIGSAVYGTGDVPFIRTTDLVNWEIQIDPLHCVSEEAYAQYKKRQDLLEGDILFVNEGAYFIGRTAMLTKYDTRAVIQSHVRSIRVLKEDLVNRYLLFWALNQGVVKKQIDDKTFMQATLPSLGNRLNEVVLPIPKDKGEKERITEEIRSIIETKGKLKERVLAFLEGEVVKMKSGRA